MAANPQIKRYLEAGMAFTQMTQAKAEEIVQDLVRAGEVQAQKAEETVAEILERSNENIERLLTVVREEVLSQLERFGLAPDNPPAEPVADPPAAKKSSKKASAGKKAASKKKAAAKKSGAKKAASKKAAPKKARTTKSGTKKAAPKKAASKKAASKKAGAKKTSAKKAAPRSSAT